MRVDQSEEVEVDTMAWYNNSVTWGSYNPCLFTHTYGEYSHQKGDAIMKQDEGSQEHHVSADSQMVFLGPFLVKHKLVLQLFSC